MFCRRGSYNLEKVLSFSSRLVRLEKSLNSAKVLEKYLISLLGLEKSLKLTTLSTSYTYFLQNQIISSRKIWLILSVKTYKTHRSGA